MATFRDPFLDMLKGILIILVVFGHMLELGSGGVVNTLYHFVYSFHMPLFILISGYLTKENSSCQEYIRHNIRLFESYIVFQIIFCVMRIFLDGSFALSVVLVPYWTLWYILSLLWWRLLVVFINPWKYNNILCIVISFIACLIAGCVDVTYIASFQRTCYFFPFFMVGCCLAKNGRVKVCCPPLGVSIFILIGVFVTLMYLCWSKEISFKEVLYGAYSYNTFNSVLPILKRLLMIAISYVVSICFMTVCAQLKQNQWLLKIGEKSLFFYIYHTLILVFLKKIFSFVNIPNSTLALLLYATLVVITLYKLSDNTFLLKMLNPITSIRRV